MSDEETKTKHYNRRKRNYIAKALRDPGDNRGAFALKVIESKKQKYKRVKLKPTDTFEEDGEYE